MQEINKAFIYKTLNQMRSEGIDVTEYFAMLVGMDHIPYEVIVFINNHHPIEKLTTYNQIYNKRRNSTLFRNMMKPDLPEDEKVIVLSSLLTQSLIGAKHADAADKDALIDAVNVDLILDALTSYIYEHNVSKVNDAFDAFQTIFKTLFPKRGKK